MGREAVCAARIDGKADQGKALLETTELLFRGEARVRVPFAQIRSVTAARGILKVAFGERELALTLGAQAAAWEAKIKNPPSRLDKLGVKAGLRVVVVGALEADALAELKARTQVKVGRPRAGEGANLIFLVVETLADLDLIAPLTSSLVPDGALWVVRRKGKDAPVTERESMAAGKAAGLVDTKVVGFSETHTAERYVIPVAARAQVMAAAKPAANPRAATKAKARVKSGARPATKSGRG